MFNSIIIAGIVICIIIDVSVALIIKKAGGSFILGLIPCVQFVLLGKITNKFAFGAALALLVALSSLLTWKVLSLRCEQADIKNIFDEPQETMLVVNTVQDGNGNIISESTSYEELPGSSATDRFFRAKETPEMAQLSMYNRIISIVMFVFYAMVMSALCRKFNKSTGFLVGIIILPFIFLPVMALDGSSYSYWD